MWWEDIGEKKPRLRYQWGAWWCATGGGWYPTFSGGSPEDAYNRCKNYYLT